MMTLGPKKTSVNLILIIFLSTMFLLFADKREVTATQSYNLLNHIKNICCNNCIYSSIEF